MAQSAWSYSKRTQISDIELREISMKAQSHAQELQQKRDNRHAQLCQLSWQNYLNTAFLHESRAAARSGNNETSFRVKEVYPPSQYFFSGLSSRECKIDFKTLQEYSEKVAKRVVPGVAVDVQQKRVIMDDQYDPDCRYQSLPDYEIISVVNMKW
jgi:hypothetical protein